MLGSFERPRSKYPAGQPRLKLMRRVRQASSVAATSVPCSYCGARCGAPMVCPCRDHAFHPRCCSGTLDGRDNAITYDRCNGDSDGKSPARWSRGSSAILARRSCRRSCGLKGLNPKRRAVVFQSLARFGRVAVRRSGALICERAAFGDTRRKLLLRSGPTRYLRRRARRRFHNP